MATKKMTTAEQFDALLPFIEEHPEIVTGKFTKICAKNNMNELSNYLKNILNSMGPRVRDEESWKKVWADMKNKARVKLRKMYIEKQKTGGGSNKLILSKNDERIYNLTGMMKKNFTRVGLAYYFK